MSYSLKKKAFTNYSGQTIPEYVSITFGEQETLKIIFDQDISAYRWTLTASHQGSTILYTANSDIKISGNKMEIPVNAYTKEFQNAAKDGDFSTFLEIFAVDSDDHVQHVIVLQMIARASNISGSTPPELILPPSGNYVTPEQLETAVNGMVTPAQLETAVNGMVTPTQLGASVIYATKHHLVSGGDEAVFNISSGNKIFYHKIRENDVISITFDTVSDTDVTTAELWLTMPDPAVSFSFSPANILWLEEPGFSDGDTLYCVVLRHSKSVIVANVAYQIENWSQYEQQQ